VKPKAHASLKKLDTTNTWEKNKFFNPLNDEAEMHKALKEEFPSLDVTVKHVEPADLLGLVPQNLTPCVEKHVMHKVSELEEYDAQIKNNKPVGKKKGKGGKEQLLLAGGFK